MIKSELLKDKGVLIVSPVRPLAASDFEHLAQEIDPYIEQNGRLPSKIEKVAAVSDGGFLRIIPSVASHFVEAEIKHFNFDDKDKALEWLVTS